jgi:Ca-activated chloride channel family protein
MDITFEHLGRLHLLWVAPLLAALCYAAAVARHRAMRRFATENLIAWLAPTVSPARRAVKSTLVIVAIALLAIGAADPRWGIYYVDVQRRGVDVFFCLDVSRSMLAEDASPNRLERAKQYIRDMLEAAHGDRVGLITVAGEAALQCPLTVDYGAMRMILDDVDTRSGTRGGSLLGDAIRLATESFTDEVKGYKAIILFSDGGDQESFPAEAARKAADELGIRIYTIGLGDVGQGARIPIGGGANRKYLEFEGQQVWTKLEPDMLRRMAVGGDYIPAGTSLVDMGRLYERRIATADQREFDSRTTERKRVQFVWFVVPAALLLLVESLLSDRRVTTAGDEMTIWETPA